MRRPKKLSLSLSLALAGAALFAASTAEAGLETICTTCAGQTAAPKKPKAHAHLLGNGKKTGHLCAACAAKMKNGTRVPATVASAAVPVPCASCAGSAIMNAPSASEPGYAIVGDGSPAALMAANGVGGNAPGYAIVGGTIASSEPAPIGVMRTNYQSGTEAAAPIGGGMPGPFHQQQQAPGGAPGVNGIPFAQPSEIPSSLYGPPPGRRRHGIIAKIIGIPDFSRPRAEAEARKRELHAQTAYGPPNTTPTELPASMVYGGR